ncbi:hypothetical protein [Agromyces ramosus]|uniref:Uncharacterized protein n=1 Tax=Agromyces ramosus TaxID=33879 RepID=A0ABU0R8F8_9MICO|nr:hypothetical protein [Agromyces ramosus]MDQ0894364.1 hypothetical protein [Agromyces ramosus]
MGQSFQSGCRTAGRRVGARRCASQQLLHLPAASVPLPVPA